jgi:hypothetical protein
LNRVTPIVSGGKETNDLRADLELYNQGKVDVEAIFEMECREGSFALSYRREARAPRGRSGPFRCGMILLPGVYPIRMVGVQPRRRALGVAEPKLDFLRDSLISAIAVYPTQFRPGDGPDLVVLIAVTLPDGQIDCPVRSVRLIHHGIHGDLIQAEMNVFRRVAGDIVQSALAFSLRIRDGRDSRGGTMFLEFRLVMTCDAPFGIPVQKFADSRLVLRMVPERCDEIRVILEAVAIQSVRSEIILIDCRPA